MIKFVSLVLAFCFSVQAMAMEPCHVPTLIKISEASPCNGYVISPELEEKIRTDLSYKDALILNLTKASDMQSQLIKINEQEVNLYREQLDNQQQLTTWEKTMYFALGALVTGVIAYGTVQTLRH